MLVQFAFFAFGLFAVMSLVIDMGYVTLTRVQMQNAADSASVEGVRLRNVTGDGFLDDCTRRMAARNVVRLMFDDDLNPANGDPWAFGAGPLVQFEPGDGSPDPNGLNAMQFMSVPDPRVYKPELQLNQAENFEHGDMVSGTFTYTAQSIEDPDYHRHGGSGAPEFVRNPLVPSYVGNPGCQPPPVPPEEPPGPLGDNDSGFLVRLRRTRDADNEGSLDKAADVSSAGKTIPLLWGLGSTVEGGDPENGYSVRHHGFTVRGTAIANTRPAMRAGLPTSDLKGVTPYSLVSGFYKLLDPLTPHDATIDPNGTICADLHADCSGQPEVGRFVADPKTISTVGSSRPPVSPAPACDTLPQVEGHRALIGYVPVDQLIEPSMTTHRVIGFAWITMAWPACPADPTHVQVFPRSVQVVALNTAAILSQGLPAGIPSDEVPFLLEANRTLPGALLAPTLVR
jgi:hypothetical protein